MSDLSRVEQLLRNALGEDIYNITPQSRVEELLVQLNELIEGISASVDPEELTPIVTAWLAENIHDGAVVDTSLSVAGAAADSKKTGDEINRLKEDLTQLSNDVYKSKIVRHYDASITYEGNINTITGSDVWLIPTPIKPGYIDLLSYKPTNTAYKAFILDSNYTVKKIVDCYTGITQKIYIDEDGYIAVGGSGYFIAYYKINDVGDTTYENVQYKYSPASGSVNVQVGDVFGSWTEVGQKGAYLVNITQYETWFDSKEPNVITVGTGKDYTDLKEAIEYANTLSGKTIVEVYEGTYDVYANLTDDEIADASYTSDASHFVGLKITEGMTLRGIGDKTKIIIKGDISTDVAIGARDAISTLNLIGNCSVENLTVTSNHIRYPIHDDFRDNENTKHHVKDCIIKSIIGVSGDFFHGYGLGSRNGSYLKIEKCDIYPSMIYHTNNGFTLPSVVDIVDSTIKGIMYLLDYTSSVLNRFSMINSTCPRLNYSAQSGNTQQSISILIRGGDSVQIVNGTSYAVTYDTDDIYSANVRSSTGIVKGAPIKLLNDWRLATMQSDDNSALFYGVCLANAEYQSIGIVQKHGWIETAYFTGLSLSVGDKIGVVNGAFAIVQDNEIGVVKRDGLVWLY